MLDYFDGLKEWLGKTTASTETPNWLMALGIGGNLYSGYQQQKAANKSLDLQKQAFDFNKMLSQREIDRQNRAEQNLANAWTNSSFYKRKDDEEEY